MANLVYRELQPPTGIQHALFANFTANDEVNLVVGRATGIDVYTIENSRLMLTCSQELFGAVKSLASVRLSGAIASAMQALCNQTADAPVASFMSDEQAAEIIVATFGYGKVVLFGWDALSRGLKTVGMFNFEELSKGVGTFSHVERHFLTAIGPTNVPTALVDPKHTYALSVRAAHSVFSFLI